MKLVLKYLFLVLLFITCFFLSYVFYLSYKDYKDYFQLKRGRLSDIIEIEDSISNKFWVTLKNNEGFKVECGLLLPKNQNKKYPAAILMGGKTTGKYAIDYAIDIDNIIICALDYPYEPRSSYNIGTILWDLPAVREAFFKMVPSAMLAVDYLLTRKDVDTSKIFITGYSFGAPFVPVIIANDERYSAAVMVYGGGDLTSLIRHNVARYESLVLAEFLGRISGLLLHPIEPLRHVDKISPKPLLMINGSNDEQIPIHNVKLLFETAKEPKKLIWIESKHVNPNNPTLTKQIIQTLKNELVELKIFEGKQ